MLKQLHDLLKASLLIPDAVKIHDHLHSHIIEVHALVASCYNLALHVLIDPDYLLVFRGDLGHTGITRWLLTSLMPDYSAALAAWLFSEPFCELEEFFPRFSSSRASA